MSDDRLALDFLNAPVEKKVSDELALNFLRGTTAPPPPAAAAAVSPAPSSLSGAARQPAPVTPPPPQASLDGQELIEFTPPPSPPVAVASPAEPAAPPPVAAAPAPTEPPADLSGLVQPDFGPQPALPVASLAEIAAGQGAGGGGGSGWGEEDKAAVQPIAPPERTGVLGVIDKGTELAAKGLAEAAAPAAEAVGAVHGFTPELSAEDKEKSKTDVGNALLTFGRGWLSGRTYGLYQPPELTEDQKKVGGEWSQTIGSLVGMGGAIKSVASSVGGVFQGLDIAPTGIKGAGNLIKIVGEAGITGFFYDILNRVGTIAGSDMAGKPTPEFGGGMIAQGLEYGAAQLGQPEIARAIHEGAAKLGPAGMALDFMAFALGGTVAARLLGATIERVEAVRAQARAQKVATSDFNWKTDNVDEAISVLQQAQDRTARTVGKGSIPPEEASAIEAARNQAIEKNPAFRNAALYMRMGDEFKDANGNLLPADQIEAKLAQGQAQVEAEKQAIMARQAEKGPAAVEKEAAPPPPPGQPIFVTEGEGEIAPTSTQVLADLRAKAIATPDDAWVMRGQAADMPRDAEALQLMQKNLAEVRQDDQGNVWMRAAGEYPEAAPEPTTAAPTPPPETPGPVTPTLADVAATKPQGPDVSTMGTTGSMVTEAGSVSPKAAPETQGGERQVGEMQAAAAPPEAAPPEAAPPDQPMGATGTMATETAKPSPAPAAEATPAAPAPEPNWQSNPSVQHFQAQGFEFVQAKTPEEIADLQTQGFEKSGVAPDLWFKRPAPVETPGTTITPPENVQQTGLDEVAPESQAPVEAATAKEPWEMTKAEFAKIATVNRSNNYIAVKSPHDKTSFVIRTTDTSGYTDADATGASHQNYIKESLRQGKPVPAEVLADYPDLARLPRVEGVPGPSEKAAPVITPAPEAAATEYWPAKAEPRIKPLGPDRVEVSYYDGTEVQHHIVSTIEEATALKDKVWTPPEVAPVVVPPKPLSSAITGKKAGPVAGAKPVVPRGAGLHPGITGKPKGKPETREIFLNSGDIDVDALEKVAPGRVRISRGPHTHLYPKIKGGAIPMKRWTPAEDRAIKAEMERQGFRVLKEKVNPDFTSSIMEPGSGYRLTGTRKVTIQPEKENAGVQETFKAGDRVSFRNAGKDLTGTLDNAPDKDGLVDINVDVAGVKGRPPIGQLLMGFKVENLTMVEAAPAGAKPVYPKPTGAPGRKVGANVPKATEAIDKSGKEPIISTTEATQAQAQGGKADADVTDRPGKTPENVQGSSGVKGPKNVPPVADGGKAGAVPKGPGRRDDGVVQPGGSGGPGGPGSVEEVQGGGGPGKDEGNKPGAPPVHGGSPGNVAGVQRPPDYRITPGELKRPGGWKATAAQNLDIIELAKKLEAEGRWATPEEQALLVQYTGFGAGEIRNNIFPRNAYSRKSGKIDLYRVSDEWRPLAEKLMEITTPEELAEIAQSTQYAHYTSESVIRSIYKAVERMGFPGGKILEPGAGNGLFGVLIPDAMRGVSKYTGIERDSVTALVAKHLLPNQNVMRADFIKQQLPDNFFDLGIGNPPFASTTILADPRYAKLRFSLHDFFFAKTIDKIHPGGLMVFITSRFTMDKAGDKARQYLAERADLIGAIRLPQTAFKANAGTEVVTDVLFLRKRAEGDAPGGLPWMEQGEVPLTYEEKQYQRDPVTYQQVLKMVTQTKNALINEYFVAHPEMILGTNSLEGSMYGENEYTVKPLDGNIEDHFAKAVENLPKNIYSIVKRSPVEQEKIVIERDFNPLVKKEGNVYVDAKGNLMIVEQGVGVSVDDVPALKTLSKLDKVWVRDYVPLRDALKKAAHDQRVDDPDWETSQKALIKVYDAFVKKHGQILEYTTFELAVKENGVQVINDEGEPVVREYRRFKNARRMRADVESVLVYSLEKITEQGEIIKDAALTRRFMTPPVRIEPKTPFEALAVTLDEVGKLDLDLIASKLNLSRQEVIEALGDMIYKAPGATWQTSDEYLSGDVKTKLEEAQAAAKADSQYQRNVEALQLVQPTPLTPAQVSVGLGASWIEPRYIMQFAREIMDVEVPITFNAQINDWEANTKRSARERTTEWGTEDRSAAEILSHILNNKNLVIKRTEADAFGVKHTFTDDAATTRVNEIAKRMKEAFATWVWSEKQRADEFLAFYDRKYNNLADRKFDGSHLSLPGLSITYPLHDHQKRAIWRAVVTGNTLLNHAVGSGKTLEQICIGQEMKRLGLTKRVLHVVPNHMLEQFSSDFMEAYPMANIMVADEQKFHMDNRRRFMAQASLNDPDAIVITHSALGKLPMKPENVKAVRDIFIRDLEDLLASLEEDPQANRILIAKVQRRIENMEQRFDSMTNANADQAVSFEDFVGSSAILILDESHEFRKLDFITNRQAKGIDSNGSRKALDLYVKIKWLASQNEGRSHIFATGTPIVNTMGELYTLMRFFDDKGQMEADGIHFFDAWANMFGDMVSDWEKTGAGNWEEVSRFASFVNIPELMKRVKHFTDILTPSQLGGYVNLPKIEGGQATLMLAPESKAVKDYQVQVLQPRLVQSRLWKPSPTERGNPDPVINIITDGRLASIDMRYHYPNLPSDPASKLNLMIDDVIEIHHRTADYPYFDKTTGEEEPIRGAGQIVFYKLGFGKQITLNRGFDARAWVMKRFKEAGISSSQVAWIDDYKTSTAKGQMSKEVRSGAKRILIGSMAKMGTGLNVQPRMYVSHLLDPPWFPADLEQAEGRVVRQGNKNLQVIMKRWASKGSYDSTMFQMVARKAKGIDQLWSGDDSLRTMQDVSRVSQYQMAAAYSSGDQRAIELAQAHGEVARLRRLREAHHAEQRELINKESNLNFWIPRDKVQLAENRAAAAAVGGYVRDVTAKIGKQAFTPEDKRADVGMAMMQAINDEIASREGDVANQTTGDSPDKALKRLRIDSKTKKIGDINGFDLLVTTANHGDEVWATLNVQVKTLNLWVYNGGAYALIDTHGGTGLITRTINVLNKVERDVSHLESKLDEKKAELRRVQKRLGAPFPDEAALIEKEAEVSRLQAELAASGAVVPDEEVGIDIAAGLAAEKTATQRTGPTIATAMRRPLVAGARYRLGGTAGKESKTGRGTKGLPAAFTGKTEIPNAEVRSQAADVAAAQPGNRSDNLPPAGTGTKRDLEDFKLRRRQEWFRPGKKEFAKLEYSETLAASPEFQEVARDTLAQGIKKVIPVKNAYFDGAIYPEKDGDVMLLNEELSESATHRQIVDHEGTHHLALLGDPVILSLIKAVDTKSDAFKAYREVLNAGYREAGMSRLSDRAMAEEVVADYRAGLTRVDLNGQEIHLGEAFQGPDSLKHILAAHDFAHPAGGMEQAKTSKFAFRMKQPKVPITPKENKGIDKWLGEREISNFDSTVLTGNRQRAIMKALGKKKFDAEAKAIDNAMTHYIELKSFPEHVANYYQDLKPEDQKAVDLAQHTIPNNPKLKAIADEIAAAYEVQGDLALDAEVVHELRDNYAAHIWNLDKGPSVEAQRKFATKTGHAQQRTFDTEIQGLAAGYEPLVRGATNKAMIYSQDVGHTIADRQFIKGEMGKTLSTKQSDERPTQIQHPNMRGWKWAGSIEVEPIIAAVQRMSEEIKNSTKTSSTTTGPGTAGGATEIGPIKAMKEVVRTSLVIRGMTEDEANAYINRIETAAVKASTGEKATPGQAPPEKTTTVIQELRETIVKIEKSQEVVGHTVKPIGRKDLFVNAKGDIFQKVPLFASQGAAEKLNNILGTSALKGIPFLSKAIDVATRMKETILFLSGYHHQAGMRGWLLGVTGQGAKGLSPRKTYRQGLKLINDMDPIIRHGVQTGGLVLGMTPEWRESLNHEKGKIGAYLDKNKVTKAIRDKVLALYDGQINFLFGKLFPGLQAMAYVTELKNFKKKFPGTDKDEAAKKVAALQNYNFGNLNYARMGRNPTLQHILRAVFLAPQWTESNYGPVRDMVGAFMKGDKESAYIYRKFWASVFAKGIAILLLGNLAMSLGDDKSAWESFKERWRGGRLRFLGLNITPVYRGVYHALGLEPSKSQKVFSPMGHFLDVIKMVAHPLLFLHHKGSPLYRVFHEAMGGLNWKGQAYTTAGDLAGTTAGGALKGKIVKEGKGGPISISQMPSFLLGQLRGSVPIPIGNLMGMLLGEMDGFDALTKSSGTMVSSFTPKTEAQGIISDYYQAALPNRNLTPEEQDRKKLEKELLKQARSGDMDGFSDALKDAVADGKLSTTAAKNLMKEAQHPEGVASFAKLPLEVALKAFEAASDQEKELWGPALIEKVARSQTETLMNNQASLQDVFRGLGMDDFADTLDELKIGDFTPGPLVSPDEYRGLSSLDMGAVGAYLAGKITGQARKAKDPVKGAPKMTHPSKTGPTQKERLRRLGLG